ncbi:ankyrin repeat-containing domain protein [Phycomyces nitens]|nr:ankyrin repeat-containing domain protein [Phycomyces nitens]
MLADEREETLREVAALGNPKAVHHFIHAGVNINSQNKINGWTALHWAAHRGHENVVRMLLANGANPNVETSKGQKAYILAQKYPNVAELLKPNSVEQTEAAAEPELPILPAYMQNPDLQKTWLHPDEFSENRVENVVRKQAAEEALTNPTPPVEQPKDDVLEEREVLVYRQNRLDESLLGSVFVKNETIDRVVENIKEVGQGCLGKLDIQSS